MLGNAYELELVQARDRLGARHHAFHRRLLLSAGQEGGGGLGRHGRISVQLNLRQGSHRDLSDRLNW